jgi:HSP20 family protein
MSSPARRQPGTELASRFAWVDRMFDEWMRALPMRRPFAAGWDWPGEDLIRVDEYREKNSQVIRAELPGIDPEKDVEITVANGMLRISAERRVEEETEEKGFTRHEMRYGTFTRTLPLAEDATESDITASYKDGILEIRVPVAEPPAAAEPTKIAITKG